MATINISLPVSLTEQIESEVKNRSFSTRSEFFRELLRDYFSKPYKLEPFKKLPISEIERDLRKTGKYNDRFIESLISGLKRSSVYVD